MAAAPIQVPRVVLAGGGTGGHVYPALAVAAALRNQRPDTQFLFLGGDRLEARVVPASGFRFRAISVHGLAGRGLSAMTRRVRSLAELALGLPLLQSLAALRRFRPHVVIGTGGYVSGPVLLAAYLLRIPCLALDGNRTPGWTSRALAGIVDGIAVAHPETARVLSPRLRRGARALVTGLPVRPEIAAVTREAGAAALALDPALTTLLVLGGSLGSQRMNDALVSALGLLGRRDGWSRALQVLHVTGERYAAERSSATDEGLPAGYRAVSYLGPHYPESLAAADLIVSRAGASTVAEVTARGLPAVLIPWAGAATGEQLLNAEPLARAGAAVIIPDRELTADRLAHVLDELLQDEGKRARMARASRELGRPRAAAEVAGMALDLAERRGRVHASTRGSSDGRSA
jgi:UDP-N-acetylglucosamine--N-acetylmuramyl-(pentapeptide) pyrophosphoryl-undecaprenol N-acetylglucosamine transferase